MTMRSWVASLAALLSLGVQANAVRGQEAGPPTITGVQAQPADGRTLVRIETTSGSINYTSFTKNRTSVVVDLYGLDAGAVPAELPVGSPEVRSVRFDFTPAARDHVSVARFVIERTAAGASPIRQEGTALVIEARGGPPPHAAARRAASAPPGAPGRAAGATDLPPARSVDEVRSDARGDDLAVTIRGDGKLTYNSFTLDEPPRLVVDLYGVENHVTQQQLPLDHPAVSRVRVGQFRLEPDKVARVVLDLGAPRDYRLVPAGDSLRIQFGEDVAAPAGDADEGVRLGEAAQGLPPAPAASAAAPSDEATVLGTEEEEEGTLISLDLKDADIKDVLRYFSEISGLNIILDPGVTGTVTVRLIDVPWNKALDIILKSHGYGKTLDGNVLRIAEVSKLTAEEAAAAELTRQQVENRPLVTITRPISYGDAQQIATVVQSTALSKKGQIIIDARTNTLVITEVDIPEYRERILDLIKTLDTPTPQVEIEARVVETTKTFARSFGIQYGFSHRFDQSTGSTTDFTFPNNGIISGDLISGGGFSSLLPGGGWAVNLPGAGANAGIGFHFGNIDDTFQLDLALTALEDEGHGRVLSAPKITTQSNIAASIVSGQSIPVQTIANNTITVSYIAANLQLNVTPQVTADNTIILKVTVDQSSPDFGTAVGISQLPPITTRRAQTQLLVGDGGTAVIGGVFQLQESDRQNRLPFVHRLPVIGSLFRNKNMNRNNNELLIFITPKIKKSPAATAGVVPVSVSPGLR